MNHVVKCNNIQIVNFPHIYIIYICKRKCRLCNKLIAKQENIATRKSVTYFYFFFWVILRPSLISWFCSKKKKANQAITRSSVNWMHWHQFSVSKHAFLWGQYSKVLQPFRCMWFPCKRLGLARTLGFQALSFSWLYGLSPIISWDVKTQVQQSSNVLFNSP